MLAEKGFTCVQTDLQIPDSSLHDSKSMMEDYELGDNIRTILVFCSRLFNSNFSELSSAIRLSTIPFPPIIVARGSACLIAQTYISSNPASGMILISPPTSNAEMLESSRLPSPLAEFDYEPNFPIAVVGSEDETEKLAVAHRICRSENVDIITIQGLDENKMFVEIEKWLDKLGI